MDEEKEILNLISQRAGYEPGEITDEMDFEKDLNIGRSELFSFIATLEDRYKISFADEHLENVKTVGDLKNLTLDHLGVIK